MSIQRTILKKRNSPQRGAIANFPRRQARRGLLPGMTEPHRALRPSSARSNGGVHSLESCGDSRVGKPYIFNVPAFVGHCQSLGRPTSTGDGWQLSSLTRRRPRDRLIQRRSALVIISATTQSGASVNRFVASVRLLGLVRGVGYLSLARRFWWAQRFGWPCRLLLRFGSSNLIKPLIQQVVDLLAGRCHVVCMRRDEACGG